MSAPQLFPRPPRIMKQPRKDALRKIIRNREAEIYRLKKEIQRMRTPLWRRIAFKIQALRLTSRGR